MASVNMGAVLAKAQSYLNSKEGKAKISRITDQALVSGGALGGEKVYSPTEAGNAFIEVLRKSIESSGLSGYAVEAVSDWNCSDVSKLKDGVYLVSIDFVGEKYRDSLIPDVYGGINNIVALLNTGVSHTMKPVYGMWHGEETWSRTKIPDTRFIEQAISEFMQIYAAKYHVRSISVNML